MGNQNSCASTCQPCRQDDESLPIEKVGPLLEALKKGGGVLKSPSAAGNKEFFELLDRKFPELAIYKSGRIQTSPGVVEISNSPTEYYRTVGAIIALLACYSSVHQEEFGLEAVSAGERGPMSVDKVPGKFINMGAKKAEYFQWCEKSAANMVSEDDWWGMLVFLVIHDVGKSDDFRAAVNATLPQDQRSDDHDRALANALKNPELKSKFLPSVAKLSQQRQESIEAGFSTNFQLPQLGQGEIACINFKGLLELERKHLINGTLHYYFYHSIYDIAGANCNENFIYPLALVPVYIGFTSAIDDLVEKLIENPQIDERTLYFNFLHTNFKKSYPEFEKSVFEKSCASKVFRHETGLAVLRVLALTRNTYKNPQKLSDFLDDEFISLVQELAGSPVGPQIMLYYGPDLLRMGLGEDLEDKTGENMQDALRALDYLYRAARKTLKTAKSGDYQYQLNVSPVVNAIKKAGKDWKGGAQLLEVCKKFQVKNNELNTEGILEELS